MRPVSAIYSGTIYPEYPCRLGTCQVVSGSCTCVAEVATPRIESTPTPTPTPVPGLCGGDCNGDVTRRRDGGHPGRRHRAGNVVAKRLPAFDCSSDCGPGPVPHTTSVPTVVCLIRAINDAVRGVRSRAVHVGCGLQRR